MFLPLANEVCEDYVFIGVCLFTGEGGVSASLHAGIHFPWDQRQTSPQADTPVGRHPPLCSAC